MESQQDKETPVNIIQRIRKADITTIVKAVILFTSMNLSYRQLAVEMAAHSACVMSAVAWRKRMLQIGPYFHEAVNRLYLEKEPDHTEEPSELKHMAIDATVIPVEGKTGTNTKVHVLYDINKQRISDVKVSDGKQAESLENFRKIPPNALCIADRAYGRARQIDYITKQKAQYLVRVTPSNINFYYDADCTEKVDFQSILTDDPISVPCYCRYRRDKKYCVCSTRVIAVKIPDDKLRSIDRRVIRTAQKKQRKLQPLTVFFNHYLILATSLQDSPEDLATLYRQRWQIEILFKRSKGAFGFHSIRHSNAAYQSLRTQLWAAVSILASALSSAVHTISAYLFFHLFPFLFA